VVIHISGNLKRWANTANDIPVGAGDTIYVPKRPNIVVVDGAVYNSTAITFKPGKDAGWYLRQAGGTTNMANKKAIFVVRADGSVMGRSANLIVGSVLSSALQPGDMLVVPEKAVGGGFSWRSTLQVAQLVSAVGIAVQVARGF
jgi:protein involved in polysaccharide export with SLBB domain